MAMMKYVAPIWSVFVTAGRSRCSLQLLRARLGATNDELRGPWPGDELIPNPTTAYPRAVTVHASPVDIWPWLVQLGQGKAGLYSYDWLDNLVGCDIHSSNVIVSGVPAPFGG
jgi:hypothetical protein